jgi:hypothetical protein
MPGLRSKDLRSNTYICIGLKIPPPVKVQYATETIELRTYTAMSTDEKKR